MSPDRGNDPASSALANARRYRTLSRVTTQDRLNKWDHRAEWALAAVALVFLGAYSVEVLLQPRGLAQHAVNLVTFLTWAVFAVDYFARLYLAPDRRRWFFRHLIDLAVVLLPLLRPLRLVRLVVLISALQKAVGNAIRGRVVIYTVSGAVLLVYPGGRQIRIFPPGKVPAALQQRIIRYFEPIRNILLSRALFAK